MNHTEFNECFQTTILEWVELHLDELKRWDSYRWRGMDLTGSLAAREDLTNKIRKSRELNSGGIDKSLIDEIFYWGFTRDGSSHEKHPFNKMNDKAVVAATMIAFHFLDGFDCRNASKLMMELTWNTPHPAGATKILGLSDPDNFCIYDSRVGAALSDLRKDGRRIIHCPSFEKGSIYRWAEDYQKLIWMLELVRDHLEEKGIKTNISQLEMALFMMGKNKVDSLHIEEECEGCGNAASKLIECKICGKHKCNSCIDPNLGVVCSNCINRIQTYAITKRFPNIEESKIRDAKYYLSRIGFESKEGSYPEYLGFLSKDYSRLLLKIREDWYEMELLKCTICYRSTRESCLVNQEIQRANDDDWEFRDTIRAEKAKMEISGTNLEGNLPEDDNGEPRFATENDLASDIRQAAWEAATSDGDYEEGDGSEDLYERVEEVVGEGEEILDSGEREEEESGFSEEFTVDNEEIARKHAIEKFCSAQVCDCNKLTRISPEILPKELEDKSRWVRLNFESVNKLGVRFSPP